MTVEQRFTMKQITGAIAFAIVLGGATFGICKAMYQAGTKATHMENAIITVNNEVTKTKVEIAEQKIRFTEHCEKQANDIENIKTNLNRISTFQAVQSETLKQIEKKLP